MLKSEQINELATALAKAQGQMEGAKKDADNPFFRSKYADLASVVEAIRGPFAEHGLSYVQLPEPCPGEEVAVETVLMHSSGQWITSRTVVPVTKKDAQGYGSALTYARRYGLQAIAGVAAEDDDGNSAASAKPKAGAGGRMLGARDTTLDAVREEKKPSETLAGDRVPPSTSPETIEQEADRLFPSAPVGSDPLPEVDEATQRNLLLGQIKAVADKLALKAPKRAEMWNLYCRGATPENADPAALSDLLKALRSLSRAQ